MQKPRFSCVVVLILVLGGMLFAQEPYKQPPQEIVDIVDAPPPPGISLSPAGDLMLITESESMPSIATLAQPLLRIAGTRILPGYHARQVTTFIKKMCFQTIQSGKRVEVRVPEDIKMGFSSWSNDGRRIAFLEYQEGGCRVWVADAQTGEAKPVEGIRVNAAVGSAFDWLDGGHLLVFGIPEAWGDPPPAPKVPKGPNVQETTGMVAKVRTYQDLLQNPHDEALFDYYGMSQVYDVDVETGSKQKIGKPAVYLGFDLSPDGNYFLVYRVKKPYSYLVPYFRFPHNYEVWDRQGNLVFLLAELPLQEAVPIGGVPTGIRSVEWRSHQPSTLVWAEALDDGDPEKEVEFRDKIMRLSAPFEGDAREAFRCKDRYSGITWFQPAGRAFVSTSDWKRRWRTTYLADLDDPSSSAKTVWDLSRQDRYNDPGRIVHKRLPNGDRVPLQDKDWIYLSGSGSSPKGDLPFLNRMNLKTLKTETLFRCAENTYERFVGFLGESRKEIIIQHETKTDPPNYYAYLLKTKKMRPLTDYQDPAPQLTGMQIKRIEYKREDGLDLYGTLYLPPDYQEGERLPLVIWAYPREYSDRTIASQVRGSTHRFTFFRGTSQSFFVTQGYALLDGAQMPVLGDPKTMNDTFVQQIVSSAKAAIEKLDEMGIIDPNRVGVGGHSYGAFMTANLLAHCDLFAAGVARSGAYNRTLTPFGFQSERRTFWQAPELYFKVSPFMHADKINEPILLIHGEADNNSGTFPIQSRRMYHALKGHGATARLVFLPHESHGYRARESVLHVLAEMFEWFDKYVKNK